MINSKEQYKEFVKFEKENYKYSYPHFTNEHKILLKYLKLYRKYEYYYNCKKKIIYTKYLKSKFNKYSLKYGFNIPINTIDIGLCIVHIGPIYINKGSKIGKNFRIHPMTTIGKTIGINNDCPVIKDNVWIGPGARLYGDIEIGNNVVVGANSVVNKNVSDNKTIAGIPAKVINNKGYKDYFN